ncbi:MAG: Sua5/YciO/YrdC/YwlC family protein [Bacteroidia bacterium]
MRERKNRPIKPLALMYPSLELLRKDVLLTKKEADELRSIESPIVLCDLRSHPENGIDTQNIAPGLQRIGAMLPYTPLMELILSRWGKPVVATSGNISGSPIFYKDEQAFTQLGDIADLFVSHNREIFTPQDDTVVQFSPIFDQKIVLRRSRGLAPAFFQQSFNDWKTPVLAMGADMKNAFAIQHEGYTYISQYLGNLESYDNQLAFDHTREHLTEILRFRPKVILTDAHPGYFSTAKGQHLGEKWNIPVISVQHHEAHFSAVLAENNLLFSEEPVLGVIWDGTGYAKGENGAEIWGGEFFIFENGKFTKVACIDSFPSIMGDKMAKEPRLSALSLSHFVPEVEPLIRYYFNDAEWSYYKKLVKNNQYTPSSSMGRVFDAVAAILGIAEFNSFEGEAAMRLEALARSRKSSENINVYPTRITHLLQTVFRNMIEGVDKSHIAASFHLALVNMIRETAETHNITRIAFSGGVFQNAFLTDLIIQHLDATFQLYFHQQLSPNDENIALGQLAYFYLNQ